MSKASFDANLERLFEQLQKCGVAVDACADFVLAIRSAAARGDTFWSALMDFLGNRGPAAA